MWQCCRNDKNWFFICGMRPIISKRNVFCRINWNFITNFLIKKVMYYLSKLNRKVHYGFTNNVSLYTNFRTCQVNNIFLSTLIDPVKAPLLKNAQGNWQITSYKPFILKWFWQKSVCMPTIICNSIIIMVISVWWNN